MVSYYRKVLDNWLDEFFHLAIKHKTIETKTTPNLVVDNQLGMYLEKDSLLIMLDEMSEEELLQTCQLVFQLNKYF